jgi:hypothetical protein
MARFGGGWRGSLSPYFEWMPSRLLFPAAACAASLHSPAAACSYFYEPYNIHLARADPQTLAIIARPTIAYSTYTNEHWSGTVTFRNVHCLKRPRGEPCPKTLEVSFNEHFDGSSCPSVLSQDARPGRASRLRYFLLTRGESGAWRLSLATRYFTA